MSKPLHLPGAFDGGLRLLLALAGAVCWILALPSAGLWALAPLAPGALVLAGAGAGPAAGLGLGFGFGVLAAFGIYGWMFEIAGFGLPHAAVLGTYLGADTAVFAALLPLLRRSRLPLALGAAALWTALDVLRAHAGFLALSQLEKFPSGAAGVDAASPRVVPGGGPSVFRLADGTPFSPLICWENLFAGFVRRSAADGARLLVQLTNDNWFGKTAAPLQHDAASVLRGVENGLPIVVSSNTGPSLVADARGRVLARAPRLFEPAVVAAPVAPGSGRTPFGLGGWLFGAGACAAAAGAVLDGWLRRRDIATE